MPNHRISLTLILTFCFAHTFAQHCHTAITMEDDRPPATPMEGIGNSHWEITTKHDSAQFYFDQGLNLHYCFWFNESYRSFKRALEFDSTCSMCHVGAVMALYDVGTVEAMEMMTHHMKKARQFGGALPPEEKGFVRAIYLRCIAMNAHQAYIDLMRSLVTDYPDNLDLKAILGFHMYNGFKNGGTTPTSSTFTGLTLLNEVLAIDSSHIGANHYLMHVMEHAKLYQMVPYLIAPARRIAKLAPSSPHIVHMPGHLYYKMGDYDLAGNAFAQSFFLDKQYMKRTGVKPTSNWNFTHNLHYQVLNCAHSGKYRKGVSWCNHILEIEIDSTLFSVDVSHVLRARLAPLHLAWRSGDWDEVIRWGKIVLDFKHQYHPVYQYFVDGFVFYARGMKAWESGSLEELEVQADRLRKLVNQNNRFRLFGQSELEKIDAIAFEDFTHHLSANWHTLEMLRAGENGKLWEFDEHRVEAKKEYQRAGGTDPNITIVPVDEVVGDFYYEKGKYEEAFKTYLKVVRNKPFGSGMAVYKLCNAARQIDSPEYEKFKGVLRKVWKNADVPFKEMMKDHIDPIQE